MQAHEVTNMGKINPSTKLIENLLLTLMWQTTGDREATSQSRYFYPKDILDTVNNVDFQYECFLDEDTGDLGWKLDIRPVDAKSLPPTDEEDYGEALGGEE